MAKIKICGLFRPEDIGAVNEARPDYVGFVFAPSRRQVTPEKAAALRGALDGGILPVGVFVDTPAEDIAALYDAGTIALAQLHGREDEDYFKKLRSLCPAPIIKAVRVRSAEDIEAHRHSSADWLLLDSGAGSGRSFDWTAIPPLTRPYFLAGGIGEETIQSALRFGPYGIDVSSGAETDGVKDREKILSLVKACRER